MAGSNAERPAVLCCRVGGQRGSVTVRNGCSRDSVLKDAELFWVKRWLYSC